MKTKSRRHKASRARKPARRARRSSMSMKIMSFFKGGKVLAGKFASVLF